MYVYHNNKYLLVNFSKNVRGYDRAIYPCICTKATYTCTLYNQYRKKLRRSESNSDKILLLLSVPDHFKLHFVSC